MGRNGNASIHIDNNFSCEHDHVYVIDTNKNNKYIYYHIKCNLQQYKNNMIGSTVKGTSKEILNKQTIKVLNKKIIEKKLQPLFNEVEKMKEDLEKDKLEHSEQSLKFMKMIDPDYKQIENNISDTDMEEESSSPIDTTDDKPKKKPSKKSDSDTEKDNDTDNNSESEDNSDTEAEDVPIKKKAVKKPSKKSDSDTEEDVPIKKKAVKKSYKKPDSDTESEDLPVKKK
jgi:hypothetical protein